MGIHIPLIVAKDTAMRLAALCLTTLMSLTALAQFYTTGDDPLGTRLVQVETSRLRIISDTQMTAWSHKLATIADSIAWKSTLSLGHTPKRIDVTLHSSIAYSNGLVSWAPSRLEMYTYAPSDDADCIPWMTHLAAHEYRHVIQTSMMKQGFTRFLYGLFGEQAVGLVLGAYVPLWLMEGDAVVNETSLTQGGRGRMASFCERTRMAILNEQTPSYDRAYMGSYKRMTEDYYRMGYLTVSSIRARYGTNVWQKALTDVARKSFCFVPFNRSLRQSIGMYKTKAYYNAMADWRARWAAEDSTVVPTPLATVATASDDYTDYASPRVTANGIIAVTSGPGRLTSIVNTNGRRIATIPLANDKAVDANDSIVVWCERRPHWRWENAGQSVLRISDVQGRHRRTLLGGQLSAPSISVGGRAIAVVATGPNAQHSILVIDIDRESVDTLQLGNFEQAVSTTWINDSTIAYISLTDSGKAINAISIGTRKTSTLKRAAYENIQHLTSHNGQIYYTSDATGINNIYTLANGESKRITSARYGASWPCPTDTALIYANLTTNGYDIASAPADTQPTDNPQTSMFAIADILTTQEHELQQHQANTTDTTHTQGRYLRIAHLFRPHSWGPVVVDANNNTISAGLAVASQNTLGNSILSGGIDASANKTERYFANYTFTALYPKIELSAQWGHQRQKADLYMLNPYDARQSTHLTYNARQRTQRYKVSIYLPINLSSGAWNRCIQPSFGISHRRWEDVTVVTQNNIIIENNHRPIGKASAIKMFGAHNCEFGYALYMSATRQQTQRDVGCRLGLTLMTGFLHTPFGTNHGTCIYALSNIYLPGIGRHHNIWLQAQAQKKTSGEIRKLSDEHQYALLLSDITGQPRGLTEIRNTASVLLRANYTLPLVNPDLSMGPVCYLKRVNLRMFFDAQILKAQPYGLPEQPWGMRSTAGAEIWAETNWLHLPYPVSIGYRASLASGLKLNSDIIFSFSIK